MPENHHLVLLTVENVSGVALETNAMQITARTDDRWVFGRHKGKKYVLDQENNERWMLFNDTPIFHGAEHTYELCHAARVVDGNKFVDLSVFTRNGIGRYTLEIIPNTANKGN